MRGIVLFIVAVILGVIFMPFGILYSMITLWVKTSFKTWLNRISSYFMVIAISIDQMGNVIMQDLFNQIMITPNGYKFGNVDETISSVLGKNQLKNTLKFMGKALNWILNKLDPGHSVNSIENNV